MSAPFLIFSHISFRYPGAAEDLFQNLTVHFAAGWSGIVGANGCGKTTLLRLATGLLQADSGQLRIPPGRLYCPQRTDDPSTETEAFMADRGPEASRLRRILELEADWLERWPTLSHGERKRLQIAAALWRNPDLLALDEPFNHLDRAARDCLCQALSAYRGVGLLVSHDREILDSLCSCCLILDPPRAVLQPGGYSRAMEAMDQEVRSDDRKRQELEQVQTRLHRELQRRQGLVANSRSRVSKRKLARKDHDGRVRIDGARLSGKDGAAGRQKRRLQERLERDNRSLENIPVHKRYRLGIDFPADDCRRDFLFSLPFGTLPLGGGKTLDHPELTARPEDRIGLTGCNGSGKSSLVRHLLGQLTLDREKVVYVPQEIAAREGMELQRQMLRLPEETRGFLMTILSRLGSRPSRFLHSQAPSPGETRKLLLALGLTRQPQLIVMDEPTNHMDLPSIVCLEQALADIPCGLLLVSHDRRFLEALTTREWAIRPCGPDKGGSFRLHIEEQDRD